MCHIAELSLQREFFNTPDVQLKRSHPNLVYKYDLHNTRLVKTRVELKINRYYTMNHLLDPLKLDEARVALVAPN